MRDCEKPLQYLADFGHELILVQVWADEDREPPWEGELELEDAETGQQVELAFDRDARAQYTAAFDAYAAHLRTRRRCATAAATWVSPRRVPLSRRFLVRS